MTHKSTTIKIFQHILAELNEPVVGGWRRASMNIPTDETYKLTIEAKAGIGGHVAIDDVSLSPGCNVNMEPCGKDEFTYVYL